MTPSFFDEAAIDLEKPSLPSLEVPSRQFTEDYSLASRSTPDQLNNSFPTSALSAISDWDGFLFPDEVELTADSPDFPSFSGRISSLQRGSGGAKSQSRDDSYDQVASLTHSSKR